KNT
ncbi:phage regulatory protein Rha, partial [Haemophilus influenzae]